MQVNREDPLMLGKYRSHQQENNKQQMAKQLSFPKEATTVELELTQNPYECIARETVLNKVNTRIENIHRASWTIADMEIEVHQHTYIHTHTHTEQ